jgi:uncharacterized protein YegL
MHVYLLLDRSASMENLWNEAIGSINHYVLELKKQVSTGLDNDIEIYKNTKITIAVFDSVSYDIARDTDLNNFIPISISEYSPRGATPLYDSAARLITRALEDKDEKAILITMTDGYENASKMNLKEFKEKLRNFENKKYQVVFLGADFDVVSTAHDVGVSINNTLNFMPNTFFTGMSRVATASASYATNGTIVNFTEQDRKSVKK